MSLLERLGGQIPDMPKLPLIDEKTVEKVCNGLAGAVLGYVGSSFIEVPATLACNILVSDLGTSAFCDALPEVVCSFAGMIFGLTR